MIVDKLLGKDLTVAIDINPCIISVKTYSRTILYRNHRTILTGGVTLYLAEREIFVDKPLYALRQFVPSAIATGTHHHYNNHQCN